MNKYKNGGSYKLDKPFCRNSRDYVVMGVPFAQMGVTEDDCQNNITCYACGEKGHKKQECPKVKREQMHIMNEQEKWMRPQMMRLFLPKTKVR